MQKVYLVWSGVDHVGIDCWSNLNERFVEKIFTSRTKAMEYMLKETEGKDQVIDGDSIHYTDEETWPGEDTFLYIEEYQIEEEA